MTIDDIGGRHRKHQEKRPYLIAINAYDITLIMLIATITGTMARIRHNTI